MRPLLASALFAIGCSFALMGLRGGDHVIAAVTLMAACSLAAVLVRTLGAGQLVDHFDDARYSARDR